MARQSYATGLDAVSTDITEVGGQGAAIGDQRDDINGNKYILFLSGGTILTKTGVKLSADNTVVAHTTYGGVPIGIAVASIASGSYGWVQIEGVADILTNASVDYGDSIFFTTNGAARGSAMGDDLGNDVFMSLGTALTSDGSGAEAKMLIRPHCWTSPA